MLSDSYVKYEEAEVHSSAIMQDFRDNEKTNLNGRLSAILDFITAKLVMGYPCDRLVAILKTNNCGGGGGGGPCGIQ